MLSKPYQKAPAAAAPRYLSTGRAFLADVAAYLRSALPPAWQVEDVTDPWGVGSLVVLPADDDPTLPTFLLHERALVPHVAVIADEQWKTESGYELWPDAAGAILAMALAARPAAPRPGRKASAGKAGQCSAAA